MTTATAKTATAKTAYTEQQTKELIELYNAGKGKTVNELAVKFGRNARSIISKLAREKVYIKPEAHLDKTGQPVIKKDSVADSIGTILQMAENDTDSLTKATKTALKAIHSALISSVPLEVLTPVQEKTRDTFCDAIGYTFDLSENDRLSLRRLPLATLDALYVGVMAFDFVSDTRVTIDSLMREEEEEQEEIEQEEIEQEEIEQEEIEQEEIEQEEKAS